MGLFSFSRRDVESNQNATATTNPEKYDIDWFAPSQPLHKVSSGLLHAENDQAEIPNGMALDQSGHPSCPVSSFSRHGERSLAPEPAVDIRSPSAAGTSMAAQKADGGIGEFPVSPFRSVPSRKRFSRTFFAFSSNRKSHHARSSNVQVPPSQQSSPLEAHMADPNILPSPLRSDNHDYYYCNYSPVTPCRTSSPATPHLDKLIIPSLLRRRSTRSQTHGATLDSTSQQSSPVNYFSSDTGIHPFADTSSVASHVCNTAVFPDSPVLPSGEQSGLRGFPRCNEPEVLTFPIPPQQPSVIVEEKRSADEIRPYKPAGILRTSFSVPNLSSVAGAASRQPGTRVAAPPKRSRDIFLTAGNWCDTIIFPRPRLKAKHGPVASSQPVVNPPRTPVPANGRGGTTPTTPLRHDVASSTLARDPILSTVRSPSAPAEVRVVVSTPDVPGDGSPPIPVVDNPGSCQAGLPLPNQPPPSLTTVLEEREDLERLREQWRIQATKSLGNKHARSFSRTRSKSLSEKRIHKKGSKSNFEYLAARALLGSQSITPRILINKSSDTTSHSHSHSHSTTYSHATHSTPTLLHSSHSRSQSHGHSHSLSTSNSSKSSRDPFQNHTYSQSESWGKVALMKAGSLCGFGQEVKANTTPDDHVLPMQLPPEETALDDPGPLAKDVDESAGLLPPPNAEHIGIAISSPSAFEEYTSPGHNFNIRDHPFAKGSPPSRQYPLPPLSEGSTHQHIRTVSEYAGPHPSALDLELPITATSNVSLRHRLPPRPAAHLVVPSISHPYGVAATRASAGGDGQVRQRSQSHTTPSPISMLADCALGPHVSMTSTEFEQFGVGKALVYAVLPRQGNRA
ncbi:hypothetical protein EDC04DRAFT_2673005 [Pisolithus marmoratus]|nr:hypothetical protein EDC04DRAFT_2673005 [Pisolithus marmoratus]